MVQAYGKPNGTFFHINWHSIGKLLGAVTFGLIKRKQFHISRESRKAILLNWHSISCASLVLWLPHSQNAYNLACWGNCWEISKVRWLQRRKPEDISFHSFQYGGNFYDYLKLVIDKTKDLNWTAQHHCELCVGPPEG